MKELINPGADVVIQWNLNWYKIPFLIIEDEAREFLDHTGTWNPELQNWYDKFYPSGSIWTKADIEEFKKLYEPIMPTMSCCKLYNV